MKLQIRDLAILGLMTALLEAAKRSLDFLPNIELVTFLLIMFTIHFGLKTLAAALAFVIIECFYWGLGIWSISYLYVWPLLVFMTHLMSRVFPVSNKPAPGVKASLPDKLIIVLPYALLSGLFGLFFGALCAVTTLVISGPAAAFGWWLSGVPFDLVHGAGNFILCLLLFLPINRVLNKLL